MPVTQQQYPLLGNSQLIPKMTSSLGPRTGMNKLKMGHRNHHIRNTTIEHVRKYINIDMWFFLQDLGEKRVQVCTFHSWFTHVGELQNMDDVILSVQPIREDQPHGLDEKERTRIRVREKNKQVRRTRLHKQSPSIKLPPPARPGARGKAYWGMNISLLPLARCLAGNLFGIIAFLLVVLMVGKKLTGEGFLILWLDTEKLLWNFIFLLLTCFY